MGDFGKIYSLSNLLTKAVDDGAKGYNIGIPFTINDLNRPTGGIMKGIYYLILGAPKSGKSSFFYDQFIFNLADRIVAGSINIEDVEIILFSLEIDRVMIAAKAAVRYLFRNKKILTNIKRLLGVYGKTPEELIMSIKDDNFQKYLSVVNQITTIFTDAKINMIYDYVVGRCKKQSVQFGIDAAGKPLYQFKNRKKIMIVGIDHLALVPEIPNTSLKKTMDTVSKDIFVNLKRRFGITPVVIQQVNPEKNGEGQHKIIYGHADARDTKNTFQDCDLCIAIGSPFHVDVSSVRFKNDLYYIKPSEQTNGVGLMDRFRLFGIEKDRYGGSALRMASAFVGEVGLFGSIEPPGDVRYEKYEFKNHRRV